MKMNRSRSILPAWAWLGFAAIASSCASVPPFETPETEAPEGFTKIFNGENLTGWYGENPHVTAQAEDRESSLRRQREEFSKHWTVEDGELVNDGKGPYARSEKEYDDFELMLEYKTVPGADSGVYLRGNPQVQLWDTTREGGKWKYGADRGSGGLWNNEKGTPGRDPLVHADKPFGEWNGLRVRLVGSRTWVWLNGELVVDGAIMEDFWSDGKEPMRRRGPIYLQTHGGEIRWRNIYIREIGGEEANRILASFDRDGMKPIFNGTNFEGWQGATNEYKIEENGVITASGGGHLFTRRKYDDFVWHLKFKLLPGANNGLAIRYSGEGNPAYSGMCELQVLDNSAEKYADLKDYQYHGSVYAQHPAHRGYLRPVGEWNFGIKKGVIS